MATASHFERFPYLDHPSFAEPDELREQYGPGRYTFVPSPRQIETRCQAINEWKLSQGIPPGVAWGDGRSRPPGSA
jgi:hypothetical protein